MRKGFCSKVKKTKKSKKLFFFVMLLLGIIISFNRLENSKIKIDDKELVSLLLKSGNSFSSNEDKSLVDKIVSIVVSIYENPVKILSSTRSNLVEEKVNTVSKMVESASDSLIYIYNTHQGEEYAASDFLEYSVKPTVMMNDYILEEQFNKNGFGVIVEERKIKDVLNNNNWKYSYSYRASRFLMEDAKKNNPSLKYFIDVHRDSLTKEKTTIEIEGKSYAKVIFLIGLENENYEKNLAFTTKLNDKLNSKYPGLSKGIYKKGGEGVNGVYNQDFSEYTILVEMGGVDNTTIEVLNTSLAFSECFMEVIKENES